MSRVYIASYLHSGDTYGVESTVEDEPSKEDIEQALKNLEDLLPEGASWIHPPKENNYFLK